MNTLIKFSIIFLLSVSAIFASDSKKYGKTLTLTEKTNISDINANPEEFVGKRVLVEGTVVGVCEKRGCWITLAGDKEFESIKIKVNDGEIVFPLEAKGKKALVEGEVYSFKAKNECKDESGKEEEHKCAHDKTEKTIYQIKGLGAVIN